MKTVNPLEPPTASKKICAGAATVPVAGWNAAAASYPACPCIAYQTPSSRM